jgi:hypothetical protein
VITRRRPIKGKIIIHLNIHFFLIRIYRGLLASGGILAIFGAFLVVTDFYAPLGVSMFGLPILVAGGIMFVLGFFRPEALPVEPEPGMKFCWYCMNQIPEMSAECPLCSLPQHGAKD